MNDEEAIKYLEKRNNNYKSHKDKIDLAKVLYGDKNIEEYHKKQEAIDVVLELVEKQKAEIETLKRDFEIVDHECSRLEKEDIRKDMIIDLMAEYISIIRDCPNEDKGANIDCENRCSNDDDLFKECWIKYFENKVKESK